MSEDGLSLSTLPLPSSDALPLVLQRVAGKDASKQFWKYHNEGILKKFQKQLQVGSLDTKAAAPPPPSPAPKKEKEVVKPAAEPGVVAPQPGAAAAEEAEALDAYGDLIPYADPSWYQSVGVFRPEKEQRRRRNQKKRRKKQKKKTERRLTSVAVPLALLQRVPRRPPR